MLSCGSCEEEQCGKGHYPGFALYVCNLYMVITQLRMPCVTCAQGERNGGFPGVGVSGGFAFLSCDLRDGVGGDNGSSVYLWLHLEAALWQSGRMSLSL